MQICPVGAESFNTDRRTDGRGDVTKLIIAFRSFVNALNSKIKLSLCLIKHQTLKKYVEVEVKLPSFLIWMLYGGER